MRITFLLTFSVFSAWAFFNNYANSFFACTRRPRFYKKNTWRLRITFADNYIG